MKKPRSFFRKNLRSETLLLAGVHPNCESMTLLISDGKTFRAINHYLRKPFTQAAVEFAARCKKIEVKLDRLDPKKLFQRLRGRLLIICTVGPWVLRTVRFGRLLGNPVISLGGLLGRSSRRSRRLMRVAMLPFEEEHSIDAGRLENCKAVFAYEEIESGEVRYAPACLWYPYRNPLLEKISRKYGAVSDKPAIEPPKSGKIVEVQNGHSLKHSGIKAKPLDLKEKIL
jgi:hypothetical protein